MKALRTYQNDSKKIITLLEGQERPFLTEGQVLIEARYSSLNYKDALGITGTGLIFKKFPLIGGIDVAGIVVESKDPRFKNGDPVLVTGCGLGETHDGGYSTWVVEDANVVVPLPPKLTLRQAMIYGTAGFTAALCAERMIHNGQTKEMGPILVSGASGGVGQFAVSLLSKLGFEVWALSGKPQLHDHLRTLGARKVLSSSELSLSSKPLDKIQLGGAIDNIGGKFLAGILPQINLWGNVACVGLAESSELNTTVMPMILRGVSLLGISSNNTPLSQRFRIWNLLASDWRLDHLENFVTEEIELERVLSTAEKMLSRNSHGRYIVKTALF